MNDTMLQTYLALPDLLRTTNRWDEAVKDVKELTPTMVERIRKTFPVELERWSLDFVDVVLGTIRARRAGKAPDDWLFTSKAMEQSTHPRIAQYHATLVQKALRSPEQTAEMQRHTVVEIGTGAGLDSRAFALAGFDVVTYEAHAFTSALARANFSNAGFDSIQVVHEAWSDHTAMPSNAVAIWGDPSRRSNNRRIHRSTEYLPPLDGILHKALHPQIHVVGVKVGPADEITIKNHETSISRHYIGFQGECKELVLLADSNQPTPTRSVTIVGGNENSSSTELHQQVKDQLEEQPAIDIVELDGRYLIEPHPAVIAAGMVSQVFVQVHASPFDKRIAYGIAKELPEYSALYQRFQIQAVLQGVRKKELKAILTELGWDNATEFKKRGWPGDPEELRKEMNLPEVHDTSTHGVVVIARVGDNHLTLLCKRC